jgi:hypothetical protein
MFRGSTFNVDGSLSGGFLHVESAQTQQVFGNRLGYLGVDLGKFGVITIGKQWSVYRDITSYSDRFNVFGARASATFIGGTDGEKQEPGGQISPLFTVTGWARFILEARSRQEEQ